MAGASVQVNKNNRRASGQSPTSSASMNRMGLVRRQSLNVALGKDPKGNPPRDQPPTRPAVSPITTHETNIGRALRAVRHVHQTAEKFRFELLVERLFLRVPEPSAVVLEWVRGPKIVRSPVKATLHKNNCMVSWNDPLVMIATLFKRSGIFGNNNSYRSKETTVRFVDGTRSKEASPSKRIKKSNIFGEINFDLASAANSPITTMRNTFALANCLDYSAKASIRLTCEFLGEVDEAEAESNQGERQSESSHSWDPDLLARGSRSATHKGDTVRTGNEKEHGLVRRGTFSTPNKSKESAILRNAESMLIKSIPAQSNGLTQPEHSVKDPTSLIQSSRFEGESRSESFLSHPNLKTVATLPHGHAPPPAGDTDATITPQGRSPTSGSPERIQLSAFHRVEQELADAYETIETLKRVHADKLRANEEELLAQRESAAERSQKHAEVLAQKEGQIKKLLAQLAELHGALDRVEKIYRLDKEFLRSELRANLKDEHATEIENLSEQNRQLNDELQAANQLLRAEGRRFMQRIVEMESFIVEQQKTFLLSKSNYEARLASAGDGLAAAQAQVRQLKQAVESCEKNNWQLREQLSNANGLANGASINQLSNQIAEFRSANAELQRKRLEDRVVFNDEIRILQSQNRNLRRQLDFEDRRMNIERRAMRKRMAEIERELMQKDTAPRSRQTTSTLRSEVKRAAQNGGPDPELLSMSRDALISKILEYQISLKNSERATKRISELERELITTKIALAEARTEQGEVIAKAKHKIEALKETVKEYKSMLEQMEAKMAEARVNRALLK